MSETEVGYWQAIVDDQRVSNERLSEALTDARTEIVRLREIIAAAALYLYKMDSGASSTDLAAKTSTKPPEQPKAWSFLTVRVNDPDLVKDLEKAHVQFTGVRKSFISEFLWAWIIPIALIFLL